MDSTNCTSKRAAGDVPLDTLDADAVSVNFLHAARYFFVALAERQPDALIMAVLASDSFFRCANGAEQMRLALAVCHEMRTSRRSVFRFSNPRCPCCAAIVTQDERYLMQLVQYAQEQNRSKVASTAMLLCEGNSTEGVIATAYAFAEAEQALSK